MGHAALKIEDNVPLIERALRVVKNDPKRLMKVFSPEEAAVLNYTWRAWARTEQIAPERKKPWAIWLYLAGRGAGKTRSGAEWTRAKKNQGCKHGAFVARTAADVRDVMIEGESGLLNCCPPWDRPEYIPSKRLLIWPPRLISIPGKRARLIPGCKIHTYTAEKPDQLRGPQHDFAWADELASWMRLDEALSNLLLGLRIGINPQLFVSTTPRPIKQIRDLLKDHTCVLTKGTTYDNRKNLSSNFFGYVIKRYEGTRLGRQEINAEVLEDNPNALFSRENFDKYRVYSRSEVPQLLGIAVGVDPAATSNENSADTGIVIAGVDENDEYWVLEDRTCHKKPNGWAREAVKSYFRNEADAIVGETNHGGEMIEAVIRNVSKDPDAGIKLNGTDITYVSVRASRGKKLRAEPVSTLAEQGRLHIVGSMPELEDQCCQWSEDLNEKSPDRMDAMVWAVTYLMENRPPMLKVF